MVLAQWSGPAKEKFLWNRLASYSQAPLPLSALVLAQTFLWVLWLLPFHWRACLKHRFPSPSLRHSVWYSRPGVDGAQEFAFLTSFQVTLCRCPKIINLSSFVLAYMIIRLKCLQKSILDYSFKMRIFFKGHLTILQVWIKTYTHANVQRITSFARVTESKLQTTWHEETAEGKNEGKQE